MNDGHGLTKEVGGFPTWCARDDEVVLEAILVSLMAVADMVFWSELDDST